jgi:hypothetical protein
LNNETWWQDVRSKRYVGERLGLSKSHVNL